MLLQSGGRSFLRNVVFRGICRDVERLYEETSSESVRGQMGRFMAARSCRSCQGRRLREEFLAVKVGNDGDGSGLGIDEFCALPIEEGGEWLEQVKIPDDREGAVRPIVEEICRRLSFLREVGLGYLALDRGASTLSGGEFQRIRLATQLGAGLSGVLYVLDEPSIGLHTADVKRLLEVIHHLVDDGHTVVVIEHSLEIMAEADHLIEIGPEAGADGGNIVAAGTPEEIVNVEESRTAPFLKVQLKGN